MYILYKNMYILLDFRPNIKPRPKSQERKHIYKIFPPDMSFQYHISLQNNKNY